ncbi:MAG: hypothetical protein JKY46_02865 [Robiginitomaculum sp.]|nr:hypothetical protein [Robiginitomaculum sp.]
MDHKERAKKPALFSPTLVLLLVLVSIFSLSAYMALSAFAPDLRNKSNGSNHAWSRSAIGLAAFVHLLEATGTKTILSRSSVDAGRPSHNLTILTPNVFQNSNDILNATVGKTLIILPKWRAVKDIRNPNWVTGLGPQKADRIAKMISEIIKDEQPTHDIQFELQVQRVVSKKSKTQQPKGYLSNTSKNGGKLYGDSNNKKTPPPKEEQQADITENAAESSIATWNIAEKFGDKEFVLGKIENLQTITYLGLVPQIWSEERLLLAKIPDKEIYILSDPDLMSTVGAADILNPAAGIRIIEGLAGKDRTVLFDLTLHGFEENSSLLRTILMPPFLTATLSAVAAVGLMIWAAWFRFGPVSRGIRVFALGKTALAINSAALIQMAGRETAMISKFAELSKTLAAKDAGAPNGLGRDELNKFLRRTAHVSGTDIDYDALLQQTQSGNLTNNEAIKIARQLYQWRGDISGANRTRKTPS